MTDLSALVTLVLTAALRSPAPASSPSSPYAVVAPRDAAVWPLQPAGGPPVVSARFDAPDGPYGAGHRGVDLLGAAGEPVHAALGGTVTFAGTVAGRGVVVVDHGERRTTYEPVEADVARGDRVVTGTVIGTLQAGGSHCPPRSCLHWGLITGEDYQDPLTLLDAGPVRLLPP